MDHLWWIYFVRQAMNILNIKKSQFILRYLFLDIGKASKISVSSHLLFDFSGFCVNRFPRKSLPFLCVSL